MKDLTENDENFGFEIIYKGKIISGISSKISTSRLFFRLFRKTNLLIKLR